MLFTGPLGNYLQIYFNKKKPKVITSILLAFEDDDPN